MASDSTCSSGESIRWGNDRRAVGSLNSSGSHTNRDLFLLITLFLAELSGAAILIALHMKGDRLFSVFLSSRPGVVFVCAGLTVFFSGVVIARRYLENRKVPSRQFQLIVTMNLVTVLLMLLMGEVTVRVLARPSLEGEVLGKQELVPKNWHTVAHRNRQLLNEAGERLTYLVYDDRLGWTVGPNRRSANGLYYSSSEGLRASGEGISFAGPTRQTRIALVGDSFTFGEDVAYEDTWGFLLEKALGEEFQVLNFGVGSYGLDQALLRYREDVRAWNPKIVILSLISADVRRTMSVYPFIAAPHWQIPFSKPRLILRDGVLTELNAPALPPQAIFSKETISELPFLEYDGGYHRSQWSQDAAHVSYLARAVMTWFPSWESVSSDVTNEALMTVNAAIVKAFVQSVAEIGAIPIVVYFPREELSKPQLSSSLGKRVLQHASVSYSDVTPCLLELEPQARFAMGGHYSPKGNAAVTKCLMNDVREAVARVKDPRPS
jgi:hypothetical protein